LNCENCTVELNLRVRCDTNKREVTTRDLVSQNEQIQPVHLNDRDRGISVVKLSRGQELKLKALAKLVSLVVSSGEGVLICFA
jgi:DNA-directed RNA polymerase II subunit RPB3